jgi:hypothetical protein
MMVVANNAGDLSTLGCWLSTSTPSNEKRKTPPKRGQSASERVARAPKKAGLKPACFGPIWIQPLVVSSLRT